MRGRRSEGFTLVELLVSLAVLGMASALVVTGVGVGNRVWERAERRAGIIDPVAAAQTIIRDKLGDAVMVTLFSGEPRTDLLGERESLFFYAPAPEADRPDAIANYRLSMSTGAELVLSTVSDLAPEEEEAPRRDFVLLRNVEAVSFDYFGAAPPDNTRRWRDRWFAERTPPELVRIRVRFPEGDPRRWPPLVIAPAADVDLNCVFSIQTGRCKGR